MDIEYTNPQPVPDAPVQPEYPEHPAPEAPAVRRVGTFTMGVTMIVVGLLIVLSLFGWGVQLEWVFRLAPLILVALGAEVLVGAFSQGKKLRYDFLSIVVCGILTLAALAFAAVPYLLWYVGPVHEQAERQLENRVYERILSNMPGDGLEALNVSVSMGRPVQNADNVQLQPGDYLTVSATLSAADEADFLEKIARINAVLADEKTTSISAHYTCCPKDGVQWQLQVYDRLQLDDSAGELKPRIEVRKETEYGWLTDEEYAREQADIEAESRYSAYEEQLQQQAADFEAQLEEERTSHENEMSLLREEYEQQIAALREEMEAQNAA